MPERSGFIIEKKKKKEKKKEAKKRDGRVKAIGDQS